MTTATTTTINRMTDAEITTDAAFGERRGQPESEFRVAARKRGLTIKELAALMGVSASHLSQAGAGRRPWTQNMRDKAMPSLGEVPGQDVIYRQKYVVNTQSSYIRERAPWAWPCRNSRRGLASPTAT